MSTFSGNKFVQEHMVVVEPEKLPDSVMDYDHQVLVDEIKVLCEDAGWFSTESVLNTKKFTMRKCNSCFPEISKDTHPSIQCAGNVYYFFPHFLY
jgi:hypothetical protein